MHPEREAHLLSRYLTRQSPTAEVVTLYTHALENIDTSGSPKQERIWQCCCKYPGMLPLADAALATSDRYHPVRQRIFIMLAILETQPGYTHFFLPRKRPVLYIARIFFSLASASLKFLAGKIALWFT